MESLLMSGNGTGTMAVGLMLAGVVAGLSSGILGFSGGIVLVPALFIVLREFGMLPGVALPVAVGTSLAAMLPAALSLLQNYTKNKSVNWPVFRHRVWIYALAGAIGAGLVAFLPAAVVVIAFGVVALIGVVVLFLGTDRRRWRAEPYAGIRGGLIHTVMAFFGTMTGAGVSILTTPYLTLCGVPKDKSAALASAFEAVATAAGAVVMIGVGLYFSAVLPENSLGFVNYAAFAVTAPVTFLVATFTASYAGTTDHGALRKVLAVFVLISVYKMFDGAMPLLANLTNLF